jgi:hypothetical protein
MPQTGRAQIGPVISTIVQNTTPTSAVETAIASALWLRLMRYHTEATAFTKKHRNATQADGT